MRLEVTIGGAFLLGLSACGDSDDRPPRLIPSDYRDTFTQLRACRAGDGHGAEFVELYVAPDNAETYARCVDPAQPCTDPLPLGTLVVKAHYDGPDCSTLTHSDVAMRVAEGALGDARAWAWQEVDGAWRVTSTDADEALCLSCHAQTCSGANGFDLRCFMAP